MNQLIRYGDRYELYKENTVEFWELDLETKIAELPLR